MAKYAIAESHIWGSNTPLRTSDHLRVSFSSTDVLFLVSIFQRRLFTFLDLSIGGVAGPSNRQYLGGRMDIAGHTSVMQKDYLARSFHVQSTVLSGVRNVAVSKLFGRPT
jgi:hypothetical protein